MYTENTQLIFQKEDNQLNVVSAPQQIFSTCKNEKGNFFVKQGKHYRLNLLVFLEELSPEINIHFSMDNYDKCEHIAYVAMSSFASDSVSTQEVHSVVRNSFEPSLIMGTLGNNGKAFFKINGSFKANENAILKPLISISSNSEYDKICKGSYFEISEI